nr:unnamed protein product [Fasciola hepatica]CAK6928881.1 unnamed protein product [Fasciola hepatica]
MGCQLVRISWFRQRQYKSDRKKIRKRLLGLPASGGKETVGLEMLKRIPQNKGSWLKLTKNPNRFILSWKG